MAETRDRPAAAGRHRVSFRRAFTRSRCAGRWRCLPLADHPGADGE